jgi:hypothetical protein
MAGYIEVLVVVVVVVVFGRNRPLSINQSTRVVQVES